MAEYIEREAAVKAANEWVSEACMAPVMRVSRLFDKLQKVPAADVAPVVHWVLTDEKLPPEGQDVLCWYEYFRFGEYYRMYQTFGIGYQFNGNWGGEVAQGQKAKVLAWMPLPRPPKMEGDESGETN